MAMAMTMAMAMAMTMAMAMARAAVAAAVAAVAGAGVERGALSQPLKIHHRRNHPGCYLLLQRYYILCARRTVQGGVEA
jgi:hypothetical protein